MQAACVGDVSCERSPITGQLPEASLSQGDIAKGAQLVNAKVAEFDELSWQTLRDVDEHLSLRVGERRRGAKIVYLCILLQEVVLRTLLKRRSLRGRQLATPEGYMSNTLKLIERVRSTTHSGTDYAVAKALGMQQSYLIEINKGHRFPGQKAQMTMATILNVDLRDIVALINEDKAKSEAERLHWRSLCSEGVRALFDIAGKTAASFIAATTLIVGSALPVENARAGVTADLSELSIMRSLMRYIRRLQRRVTGALPPPWLALALPLPHGP